jgi:hypothetical protein
MAFKQPKARGRPQQKFLFRKMSNYGNIFPKGTTFHKYDKETDSIVLKRKKDNDPRT